jgi:hypothetical protein
MGGTQTSKATLEYLLAYSWDINTRRSESGSYLEPFMWRLVTDGDMVSWFLEHGVSVHPKDQEPLRDDIITPCQLSCPPIVEKAAAWSSIEIFELVRSKGAPLGWRSLHLGIETATLYAEKVDEQERVEEKRKQGGRAEKYAERLAMIHHLLDVVGLDVNTPINHRVGGCICVTEHNLLHPWIWYAGHRCSRADLVTAGSRCGSHSRFSSCGRVRLSQIYAIYRRMDSTARWGGFKAGVVAATAVYWSRFLP